MRIVNRGFSMLCGGSCRQRGQRRNRGLSLIEALISLAIAAMLLTAVAAAYAAASDAIKANDQFFRASQAARVTVNQITKEVRTCQSGVVDTTTLELTTAGGQIRTYAYDATTKKLMMSIDAPVPMTAPIASNVEKVLFQTEGQTISVSITVKVGVNEVTLNGSAIPRRTLTYQ
jgi:prepilin-type N-terminal cleavage/methylation domain-containing protein